MRPVRLGDQFWPEYRPPGTCGFDLGIGEALGLTAAAGAGEAAAATAAADAAVTSGLAGAEAFGGAAAGLTSVGGTAAAGGAGILSTVGSALSSAAPYIALGSAGLQAIGQAKQASYEEAVGKSQAEALRIKAGEEAAAGQRQQIMQERRTGLITSRARALAADSGTDATSPTEVTNEGLIAQQGAYNAQSALYQGLAASRSDDYQASIDLFKAGRIASAAPLAVGGTILSGLSSFADRKARLKYFTSSGGDNFFGFGGS